MKKFEELDVIDDFLMNALASDVEVGEKFCRMLLKGLLQQEMGPIRVSVQRVITPEVPKYRGIRLDVQVVEYEDNTAERSNPKNIYDLEPHLEDGLNLPKHNRFYQAKIDGRNMTSGEKDFVKLPNLYIITITNYDPFGYGYMMYTVNNVCQEVPELVYEDGLKFIYFNTKGTLGGTKTIKNLLNYIQESKIQNVTDDITKEMHECVCKVKTLPEVRSGYMTLEEKIFYERLKAKEEGREEGRLEVAKKLLQKGMPVEEICELMECDIEYIRKIQDDINMVQ